jgi:iron-sulfur cluster repair protein YtfE (RIC family)
MTLAADTVRSEHAELLEHVDHIRLAARELPELSNEEREVVVGRVLDFLQNTLVPHAETEERMLYVVVGELIGGSAATAPMVADHEAIRVLLARLEETDLADTALLQELLYGLHALITTHFRKEEELYLPLLDRDASGPVVESEEANPWPTR